MSDVERNSRERPGVLLIHGFGGGREELAPLEEHLKRRGFETRLPLLPGHGGSVRALGDATRRQWRDTVENAYLELLRRRGRVAVVGFSMGGLLAANLWNYRFDSLILINTPVYYWNLPQMLRNLREDRLSYGKKYWRASTAKPFPALLEFQLLLSSTKPLFRRLNCRTLIVQAVDDDTVWPVSGDYILRRIRGFGLLLKLPEGGHQVLWQARGAQTVFRAVDCFLDCDAGVGDPRWCQTGS